MSAEQLLERSQTVDLAPADAFALFADAQNLEAITPPWLRFRILTPGPVEMGAGTLISYRLSLHGVPVRWHTRIEAWEPPRRFVDVQISGPYALWHHTHEFTPAGEGTLIRDRVRFRIGFGPLGEAALRLFVRRDLERIFDYRRAAIERLVSSPARPARAA
jgi:ligand-binding SRPBCC domain-containing protein